MDGRKFIAEIPHGILYWWIKDDLLNQSRSILKYALCS